MDIIPITKLLIKFIIKLLILFLLAYKLRKNITIAINPLTKESFKLPPKNKVNEDAASTWPKIISLLFFLFLHSSIFDKTIFLETFFLHILLDRSFNLSNFRDKQFFLILLQNHFHPLRLQQSKNSSQKLPYI